MVGGILFRGGGKKDLWWTGLRGREEGVGYRIESGGDHGEEEDDDEVSEMRHCSGVWPEKVDGGGNQRKGRGIF